MRRRHGSMRSSRWRTATPHGNRDVDSDGVGDRRADGSCERDRSRSRLARVSPRLADKPADRKGVAGGAASATGVGVMLVEGAIVGAYRVRGKLGEGGMGAVYLAEHTLLGRTAAIKMLLPEVSVHDEMVQRFFNEARAVTQIVDPGIVQVFDFGYHSDGSAYLVM